MTMNSKEYIYVFFTKTGKEKEAADDVRKMRVIDESITPLNYTIEVLFKKKGEIIKEIRPIFPGYLFVASSLADKDFILKTHKCIKKSPHIIRLLKYGDTDMASLSANEKNILKDMLKENSCISTSVGYILENKLVITEGPLKGKENLIKSFNRHKKNAIVELSIMGEERKIIIGLEILERK